MKEEQLNNEQLTEQKSQQQAEAIVFINTFIKDIDSEYLKMASNGIKRKANWQENMILFNPSHNTKKIDLLRAEAKALSLLADYKSALDKIAELKKQIGDEEINAEAIKKLFQ